MKAELIDKRKYIYLEVMRVIAIFFVIFNHTGDDGFFLFSVCPPNGLPFWVYLFISVFCKFSVPLFFAISGALMLGKETETLGKIWGKRILRMVVLLIVFSFAYYCDTIWALGKKIDLGKFFSFLYAADLKYQLWFLYSYIAYLVSIPFLQALVKTLEKKYYFYLIVIALFMNGVLPIMEYLIVQDRFTLNENLKVTWLVGNIVLYPCVGYFLQHKIEIKKKDIVCLWVINAIGICVSCYMTYYKGIRMGFFEETKSQAFHNSFVLLNMICIFITIKYIFERIELAKWGERIVYSLGECTFGIYLFHAFFLSHSIRGDIIKFFKKLGINYMVSTLIMCLCVMILSWCLVFIIKKVPFLKKII